MSASPMESWALQHSDRGLIEVHIGTGQLLQGIDPGFPAEEAREDSPGPTVEEAPERDETGQDGAAASTEVVSAEESEESEKNFLEQQLAKLNWDAPQQRVLIRINGDPAARLKNLKNFKVSLKPCKINELKDGEYTSPSPAIGAPMIVLESNFTAAWLRNVVFKVEGEPGIELDPPKHSFAAKRLEAMAASLWKRVVYPLSAGLSKGGGALAGLFLIALIIQLLDPVIVWLRELLPGWEIDIPWPEINWPEIALPEWVIFLLSYSKVWIPVLIGAATECSRCDGTVNRRSSSVAGRQLERRPARTRKPGNWKLKASMSVDHPHATARSGGSRYAREV